MVKVTPTGGDLRILMLEDAVADVFFYSDLLRESFENPVQIDVTSRLKKAVHLSNKLLMI